MVVIKVASYKRYCPFSKRLIKPTNIICLFNQKQFDAFNNKVIEILHQYLLSLSLSLQLPLEIVNYIIEQTGYKKYINQFGHSNITHWTAKHPNKNTLAYRKLTYNKEHNKYKEYEDIEDIEDVEGVWENVISISSNDESNDESNE